MCIHIHSGYGSTTFVVECLEQRSHVFVRTIRLLIGFLATYGQYDDIIYAKAHHAARTSFFFFFLTIDNVQ